MDVVGTGRTDPAETIGRGGRDSTAKGAEQGQRYRVIGHAETDTVLPAGYLQRRVPALEYQREGTGPETSGQLFGGGRNLPCPFRHPLGVADMDDQRMAGGPTLDGKYPLHRLRVAGIRAKAIDGFGRKGHHAALAKLLDGQGNIGGYGHVRAVSRPGVNASRCPSG